MIREHGQLGWLALDGSGGYGDAVITPRDNIGNIDVVRELDVGRRDDGLVAVVGFGGNGKDRLPGELRVPLKGLGKGSTAGVERRQVFRRRVVNDVGRIEASNLHSRLRTHHEGGVSPGNHEDDAVVEDGFGESSPGQAAGDKYVGPEGAGRGTNGDRGGTTPQEEVGQIPAESMGPGFQFENEPRRLEGAGARV